MQRSSKIQAIRETSGERRERTPTSELEKNSKTGTAAAFHLSRRLRSTTEDIKKDPSQIQGVKNILSGINNRLDIAEPFTREFENLGMETTQKRNEHQWAAE